LFRVSRTKEQYKHSNDHISKILEMCRYYPLFDYNSCPFLYPCRHVTYLIFISSVAFKKEDIFLASPWSSGQSYRPTDPGFDSRGYQFF
jgi:hypothetical protein